MPTGGAEGVGSNPPLVKAGGYRPIRPDQTAAGLSEDEMHSAIEKLARRSGELVRVELGGDVFEVWCPMMTSDMAGLQWDMVASGRGREIKSVKLGIAVVSRGERR